MHEATREYAKWWRELSDQLTVEQITEIEKLERDSDRLVRLTRSPELGWTDDALISIARSYARENLLAAMIGPVPLPGGTESSNPWEEHDPSPYRVIWGRRRAVHSRDDDEVIIQTSAIQFSDGGVDDGTVAESPAVHINNCALTSWQARELAAALIEGADEADRLADSHQDLGIQLGLAIILPDDQAE
jgi:hypothetical protein